MRIFLATVMVMLAASGCDWRRTATAPFRKTGAFVRKAGRTVTSPISGWGDREEEDVVEEFDFVLEVSGRRRTSGHRVRRRVEYGGREAMEDHTEQTTTVRRNDVEFTRRVMRREVSGMRGRALYLHEITEKGSSRSELTIEVGDGVAVFTSRTQAGKRTQKVRVPSDVLFGMDHAWLAQQSLSPGRTFEADVLSRSRREVVNTTGTVLRTKDGTFRGRPARIWVVRTVSEANPETPVTITFTEDGRLIRMETEAAVYRVLDADEDLADLPGEIDEVVTSVPVDPMLPAFDAYDRMTVEAVPVEPWAEHIEASDYCSSKREEDGGLVLTLQRVMPRVPRVTPFPADRLPPEVLPFTQAAGNITPDNPMIARKARKITENEDDALRAVAYLAGWVHARIRWTPREQMNQSPAETIESQRGDCSEHADLFASLARSVGIPTRHCLGLQVRKGEAVYHNWVEAFVGGSWDEAAGEYRTGVWVPVDTTVNRVGLPAGYILTARDENAENELQDGFPWAMRQQKLGLRIRQAQRGEHVLTPGKRDTYVAVEDNRLVHLYWGFALTKPTDWDGRVMLKSIEVTSPDGGNESGVWEQGEATVSIDGTEAVYRTTRAQLDGFLRELEGLPRFRQHVSEIRRVPMGGQALFVEFTARIEGEKRRCRQYIVPRAERSYRIGFWAREDVFAQYEDDFDLILKTIDL